MCSITADQNCDHLNATNDKVAVYIGSSEIDNKPLVIIDTSADVRIMLNDGTIWDGSTETHHHEHCYCTTKKAVEGS